MSVKQSKQPISQRGEEREGEREAHLHLHLHAHAHTAHMDRQKHVWSSGMSTLINLQETGKVDHQV